MYNSALEEAVSQSQTGVG